MAFQHTECAICQGPWRAPHNRAGDGNGDEDNDTYVSSVAQQEGSAGH